MSMRRGLFPEESERLLEIYWAHPELTMLEVIDKYASDEFLQSIKEAKIEDKIMKLEGYEAVVIDGSRHNKYPYDLAYSYNSTTRTLIVRYRDHLCKRSNLDKVPYCAEQFGETHSFKQRGKPRDPIFKLGTDTPAINFFKDNLIYDLKALLDYCKERGIRSSRLTAEEVALFEVGERLLEY